MKTISQLRHESKMSQRALADALGIKSVTTVANWEQGRHDPTARQLRAMAILFGITCEQIVLPLDAKQDAPPKWTAELESQYQALRSVYGEMVKATNDLDELRALAEAVCTSPFTGYAVEVLVDWLESHPKDTEG